MKKFNLFTISIFAIFGLVLNVNAQNINVNDETSLSNCLTATEENTCTLSNEIKVNNAITIMGTKKLDLNGYNVIFAIKQGFNLKGANLTVTGKGIVKEEVPYYSPIWVYGSDNEADTNYTSLTIEKDVTLEGWSALFIRPNNNCAYGVNVDIYGTLNGFSDDGASAGAGYAAYINGLIKHTKNYPVINIHDGSILTSDFGPSIYAAGYANWNIGKSNITGVESSLGIKSGIFNIDGATVTATGEDDTPTEGFSNGIFASGAAIQVESNNSYAGDIEINIKSGTFKSTNGFAFYEYLDKSTTNTKINTLNIENGEFISNDQKKVFKVSQEFNNTIHNFISGGTYSSNIETSYLKNNTYEVKEVETKYIVDLIKTLETKNEDVKFESNTPLSTNYALKVKNLKETLKDTELESINTKVKNTVNAITKDTEKKAKDIKLLALYDISVIDTTNNNSVVPMSNGSFKITLSIEKDLLNYDNYKVVYINDNGEIVETIDATIQDGKVIFNTTHLSTYGIIAYNDKVELPIITESNPKTSDTILKTIIPGIVAIVILGSIYLYSRKNKLFN